MSDKQINDQQQIKDMIWTLRNERVQGMIVSWVHHGNYHFYDLLNMILDLQFSTAEFYDAADALIDQKLVWLSKGDNFNFF